MQKLVSGIACCLLVTVFASPLYATNGDNLIGVGPISRSMGGVGIAHPQDAISAVFANPAAMCFGPYCHTSQVDFAGTLFTPKIEAKVTNSQGTFEADSESSIYAIPAIGLSVPIIEKPQSWRFGLSAYGVTGLGVDYRDTELDDSQVFNFGSMGYGPAVTGEYTSLQIMKFAPAVAYQVNSKLSIGAALHIDYGILDLKGGSSSGYALGIQPGITYYPTSNLAFGLIYVSPQKVKHKNINDFDQDGNLDDLDLEAPQQVGFGISYIFNNIDLIIEADAKWLNWADAAGYRDFDWEDQWVYAIGAQYSPTDKLKLRIGYNYAANPVKEHNGFDGTQSISVQGKTMSSEYYYETFRIIGFPAIVEQHLTFGISYQFTERLLVNLGYMYGFEKTIRETGTDPFGQPATIKSTLSETSIDFGLTWRF